MRTVHWQNGEQDGILTFRGVWEVIRGKIRRCDEPVLFVWRRRDSSGGGAFVPVERRVSSRGGKFFSSGEACQVERRTEASFFVWRGVSQNRLRSKGKDGVNKNNFLGWQVRYSYMADLQDSAPRSQAAAAERSQSPAALGLTSGLSPRVQLCLLLMRRINRAPPAERDPHFRAPLHFKKLASSSRRDAPLHSKKLASSFRRDTPLHS